MAERAEDLGPLARADQEVEHDAAKRAPPGALGVGRVGACLGVRLIKLDQGLARLAADDGAQGLARVPHRVGIHVAG